MNNKKEEKDSKQKLQTANAVISRGVAMETASKTNEFNKECDAFRETLGAKSAENQAALNEKLHANPGFVGDRSKGVSLAYEYEVADVKMGGKGSVNWSQSERSELLETGKVRGAEGHHINNVAAHPEIQTNPDNITFYKDRKSHLQQGHGGDFHNDSSGTLIDKDKMLKRTNDQRVLKNEMKGLGIAAITGAITGVAQSVHNTCKEEGTSFKSVIKGVKESAKPIVTSTAITSCTYIATRMVSHTFDYLLKKI